MNKTNIQAHPYWITGFFGRCYSIKRLTNVQRHSFNVPQDLHEILIGSCLGDLSINRQGINARLSFVQGKINEAYILHLYDLFKDYCGNGPRTIARKPNKITGKIYYTIYFNTYSLPCFNYYRDLFYCDNIKKIPNNIGELLTPIALAFRIQDDGYFNKRDHTITPI
jgi:hypothetical protein